ncbi:hypothetical protein TrVE_jg13679 [Triparma verrucosa]|uniref:Uncharacterized protein n=2 Tax=Triparma TaxID=722752 RepID=A0A9W7B370_9STRA|nr:hypothetical protein TrST_g7898 [Triparma strigata]GMH96068.1 hypothetical protein TrVE_jg13679 [Triparma verrucosa]
MSSDVHGVHGFIYLASNLHWPEALSYLSRPVSQSEETPEEDSDSSSESPFYVEFLAKNQEGWTCLHCLICFNSPIQLFNKLFACLSVPTKISLCSTSDSLGNLPLHVACRNSTFNDIQTFKKLIQLHPVGLFSSNFKGMRPIDFLHNSVGERSKEDKEGLLKLLQDGENRYREYSKKMVVILCVKRHLASGPRCLFMPAPGEASKIRKYRNKASDQLFAANVLIEIKDKAMEGLFLSILAYAFGPRKAL